MRHAWLLVSAEALLLLSSNLSSEEYFAADALGDSQCKHAESSVFRATFYRVLLLALASLTTYLMVSLVSFFAASPAQLVVFLTVFIMLEAVTEKSVHVYVLGCGASEIDVVVTKKRGRFKIYTQDIPIDIRPPHAATGGCHGRIFAYLLIVERH